jgi:hypothetical protein
VIHSWRRAGAAVHRLARTHAIVLVGVQGHVVEIKADIENGLVALLLVGLPVAPGSRDLRGRRPPPAAIRPARGWQDDV